MKEIILKSLSEIKSNYANISNSGLKTIIMPNINMNKPEMSFNILPCFSVSLVDLNV